MSSSPGYLLIKGGRIIDPSQGVDHAGNLFIVGNIISRLVPDDELSLYTDFDVLHAEGLIVCPGFIDFHCHLRQPGFEEKETISTGTRAAARGGFTTLCCMPNTNPPLDNYEVLRYVKSTANSDGIVRVLPVGCVSEGRQGMELAPLGELAAEGVVAFSDDGDPVNDNRLMQQALEESCSLHLPIIDHCENKALTKNGVMNEGIVAARLGLPGMPASAEESIVARDLELAELTSGWLHIAHVSTEGSVELIRRAKEKGIRVTAEVTPHHLTLTEEIITTNNSNAKVNPPLRTAEDTKALIQGLQEGVIDIIATDHAPHTESEKSLDFIRAPFGISVLETAFGSLIGLVHTGKLKLDTLIKSLTNKPSDIIGDKHGSLGNLINGSSADITLFDPNAEWVVNPEDFASKGKNTPLAGSVLKGKIMATISQGKIVYKDATIKLEIKLTWQ